ncbi:Pseudouridine 5'-phosphate glycosidase [Clostridiaceae bacterium JG1575]|nr:Pseudouridine 5'-phosphate glycosidase [Clostridiaceae bacterium JG1575]
MEGLAKYLDIAPYVKEALAQGKPVVALESTIISHGMPYPQNVEMALAVEDLVRQEGAVPATIALLEGKIKIGLSRQEVEAFAKAKNVIKCSRRDLPVALALGLPGGTTVGATMIGAKLAGLSVFATGGIGGVHRGAPETFDISADLEELSRTNVCVVCAGAKAILDLPLTLEVLETKGVPVLGYQTEELPAFYTRTSGLRVDYRMDSPEEIAAVCRTKWDLGLEGGVLVTNPIPEEYAMPEEPMKKAIEEALASAHEEGIHGKESTPYLLAKIKDLTGGASLDANIQLVYNNARLASKIAKSLASQA